MFFSVDGSKQRQRLRTKISAEKIKLEQVIAKYNRLSATDSVQLHEIENGKFPWKADTGTPFFHRCNYPYQTVGCRQTDGSIQVSRGNRTSPKGNYTIHEVLQEQSFTILVQRTGATAGIVKRYFYRLFDRSGTFVITFCPIVDRTG